MWILILCAGALKLGRVDWDDDRPGAVARALVSSAMRLLVPVEDDLPLSAESGESLDGKVGSVGDHIGRSVVVLSCSSSRLVKPVYVC